MFGCQFDFGVIAPSFDQVAAKIGRSCGQNEPMCRELFIAGICPWLLLSCADQESQIMVRVIVEQVGKKLEIRLIFVDCL